MAWGIESSSIKHTNDTSCKERDQWIWLHLKFSLVQQTSKTVIRGATDWDNIMFICMNSYESRGKKMKVFTVHWKKMDDCEKTNHRLRNVNSQ